MEASESPILIKKFYSAHEAGIRALNDFSRRLNHRPFLERAKRALYGLYGPRAPIVQKYLNAVRNVRDITEDEYTALFIEFEHILNYLEFISGQDTANAVSRPSTPPAGKNIFIIHGHDEVNTLRLRVLLQEHFNLNPVVMMSKPGMSRVLLDKFEDSASTCALAFAIITPDDEILNHGKKILSGSSKCNLRGWLVRWSFRNTSGLSSPQRRGNRAI